MKSPENALKSMKHRNQRQWSRSNYSSNNENDVFIDYDKIFKSLNYVNNSLSRLRSKSHNCRILRGTQFLFFFKRPVEIARQMCIKCAQAINLEIRKQTHQRSQKKTALIMIYVSYNEQRKTYLNNFMNVSLQLKINNKARTSETMYQPKKKKDREREREIRKIMNK